jgi:hypothetical protein
MAQPRRPLGVAIIVVFELANAVLFLLTVHGVVPGLGEGNIRDLAAQSDVYRAALSAVALLALVAAVGLWFLSRRAWVLMMVLVGTALVLGLYSWAIGQPSYPRLFLGAIIAMYLNQPAVQAAVGRRPRSVETA